MTVGGTPMSLMLWDLHGEDDFQKLRMSYLRGASGYILVVDGTRQATLDKIFPLQQRAEEAIGKVPFIVILNKADLTDQWELDGNTADRLADRGWPVVTGSAKTGQGVEEAFLALTGRMLKE